ncbi:hypothetical protein BDF20DRAFT_843354 [Mycotypha africana]|uniref:uncharacterized protein n=1 Tax=Mycotypha africana TaxID=64632 RepID=UPI0023011887|nr:uncharacterized protein BDF20DRAFT_843354 [Mycotypha africana]KAI8991213.1 hypothetical protein BDF20DRAFT_843354 [Mycotypha africana]
MNKISIDFEGGSTIIIRPNRIIRGFVKLKVVKPIQASRIRIRFRAEEIATVKVREFGLENKIERIDQVTTTYFDVETKVWGNEPSAFQLSTWEIIEPGEHQFPFALKFPNVNFPPSIDDPVGFSIHYIWSAHIDGPGFYPGVRSKEYIMPYRPIICAPPTKEWEFSQVIQPLDSHKKAPLANVRVVLSRYAYCPDEDVELDLYIDCIPDNLIVAAASFTFQKCCMGQIQLQRGLARKSKTRKISSHHPLAVTGNAGSLKIPVSFRLPTRLVSPSFQSRHICVFYEIVFTVQFQRASTGSTHSSVSSLLLSSASSSSASSASPKGEFSVPIGITNLPHHHLLHIPNLTLVQSYQSSKEAPVFFDPELEEPVEPWRMMAAAATAAAATATTTGTTTMMQGSSSGLAWDPYHGGSSGGGGPLPSVASLGTTPLTSPPNYFSITNQPPSPPYAARERQERVVFTSRLIKPGMALELGEPVTLVSENKSYEW